MARDGLPGQGAGGAPGPADAGSVPGAGRGRRALALAATGLLPAPVLLPRPLAPEALGQEAAAPATIDVAGRRLMLNGTGVRRFLGFEVLRGWLYLERRSTDAAAVLATPGVKLLRLRYSVSVSRSRLVSGWEDGFRDGCGCEMPPEFRARLRDLPAGQVENWLFLPDHAEIAYAGETPVRVTAQQGRSMLASFIGPDASSAGLRRGLLGQD